MKLLRHKSLSAKRGGRPTLRRAVSALICLCMFASALSVFSYVFAEGASFFSAVPTDTDTRVADTNTMEDYKTKLLSAALESASGSRYAGLVWADKSVISHDYGNGTFQSLSLKKEDDGYAGNVDFSADFLHVYSVLASSQVINEYPPSPIDLVLVLDVSSSMSAAVEPAAGSEFDNLKTELGEYYGKDKTFAYSRFLNLVVSADRIIGELMQNNEQNRVCVVVYDRRAEVIMPLAHYTPNTTPLGELGSSLYDAKYLEPTGDSNGGDANLALVGTMVKDNVYGYLCPFFNGHAAGNGHSTRYVNVSGFGVVAKPTDADVTLMDVGTQQSGHELFDRISGTNTHAGIVAGMEQLADAQTTTLTAQLSDNTYSTVPRIPAMIVMTDGGSNTVADGQWYDPQYNTSVQRSDHMNDWSSVVVTQSLLSAAYLKSAVEKNYSAFMDYAEGNAFNVFTVGVDLRDDTDNWVPERLYPMMDPSRYFDVKENLPTEVDNPSTESKTVELRDEHRTHIGNAYNDWTEWGTTVKDSVERKFPVTRFSSGAPEGAFQQSEGGKENSYVIPFQAEGQEDEWHGVTGWSEGKEEVGTFEHPTSDEDPIFIEGTAAYETYDTLLSKAQAAQAAAGGSTLTNGMKYVLPRTVTYQDNLAGETRADKVRSVAAVEKADIINNINYVKRFYDVSSAQMESIFEEIMSEVIGEVFVPISGDNDAGVGDAVTYQDPIGQYMELKNASIQTAVHGGEAASTYDMALLLFGQMHGLVRSAVYDFQFNDAYMEANFPEDRDKKSFPEGWYMGEDGSTAKLDEDADHNGLPEGCTTSEEAWEKGYVYHINSATAIKFVPLLDAVPDNPDDPTLSGLLSEQQKNTVYTLYRFAGTAKERNALYRNPIYGDLPETLKTEWEKYNGTTAPYPDDDTLYASTPGVYRLSDIRVWLEHTGDFVDTDGKLTVSEGYDDSLYVNIPAAAVPTQVVEVTLGPDGPISYKTNLGDDPAHTVEGDTTDYYAQSTPFRLFYTVGLDDDLILHDADGNQTGVDVAALSYEYVSTHTNPTNGNIYFLSNFYSGSTYDGYSSSNMPVTENIGDPAISFSASANNRYYIYQKPLPLLKHVLRAINIDLDASASDPSAPGYYGLVAVDNEDNWNAENKDLSNSKTTWEDGNIGGANWEGGEYMGTYESQDTYRQAVLTAVEKDGKKYITDMNGVQFELKKDGLVCFQQSLLTESNVAGVTGPGLATTGGLSSDDYYFILIEYYLPTGGTGTNINGKQVPGTQTARFVQYIVARRGADFGSGIASEYIGTGDMLCWTNRKRNTSVNVEYMAGDSKFGVPTWEKLTKSEEELREYLTSECGVSAENLEAHAAHWMEVREKLKADFPNLESMTQEEFNANFEWVLAARPGGIRTGNMLGAVEPKETESGNKSGTADNYYVPTISSGSGMGGSLVVDTYLGNNGRLEVGNQKLAVTKTLEMPDGSPYAFTDETLAAEAFDYQIYIEGAEGTKSAIELRRDPYSGKWMRRFESIDLLTDNSSLVIAADYNRVLFYASDEPMPRALRTLLGEKYARQVVAVTQADGSAAYYFANDDGTASDEMCPNQSFDNFFYLYVPSDTTTASGAGSLFARRVFSYKADDEFGQDLPNSGVKLYYPVGETPPADTEKIKYQEADANHPAGSRAFWVSNAVLVPVGEVLDSADGWTYEEGNSSYIEAEPFDVLTVKPSNNQYTVRNFISPYSTRSEYHRVELNFGFKSDGTPLTAADLYDKSTEINGRPGGEPLDLNEAAKNTAEFRLRDGQGLLFVGLDANKLYRVTERLTRTAEGTPGQYEEGYSVKTVEHIIGDASSSQHYDNPTGKPDYFSVSQELDNAVSGSPETMMNYFNTFDTDIVRIEKQLDKLDDNVNLYDSDKNVEFVYKVTFKLPAMLEMANASASTDPSLSSKAVGGRETIDGGIDPLGPLATISLDSYLNGTDLHYWLGKTADIADAPQRDDAESIAALPVVSAPTESGEGDNKVYTYEFRLKQDESIVFYGLPVGTVCTVTEERSEFYPIKEEAENTNPDVTDFTASYTHTVDVARTDGNPAAMAPAEAASPNYSLFTNIKTKLDTGSLAVEKQIDASNIDAAAEFTFTLNLTAPNGKTLRKSDIIVTDKDGYEYSADSADCPIKLTGDETAADNTLTATFKLKHGDKYTFDGLLEGTSFTISEAKANGYTLRQISYEFTDAEGSAAVPDPDPVTRNVEAGSVSGTVTLDTTVAFTFHNAPGFVLPVAGGSGVSSLYCTGGVLAALVAAFFIVRFIRRRRFYARHGA